MKKLYRIETVYHTEDILLIDECDLFCGLISSHDFFFGCITEDDPRDIDDYVFYFAWPEKIKNFIK